VVTPVKRKYQRKRERKRMSSTTGPNTPSGNAVSPQSKPNNKTPELPKNTALPTKVEPPPKAKKESKHYKPDSTPLGRIALECAVFFVGCYVAWIYHGQLGAMIEANTINRNILMLGQRPWIGPEKAPSVTLVRDKKGAIQLRAALPIKNFGQSPALNSGYHMMPLSYEDTAKDIQSLQQQFCQMAELEPSLSGNDPNLKYTGFTMFPNGTHTIVSPLPNAIPANRSVAVLGCIAYIDQFRQSTVASAIHHTRFCFWSSQESGQLLFLSPNGQAQIGNDSNTPLFECNLGNGAD
jgi:hypothetical protein